MPIAVDRWERRIAAGAVAIVALVALTIWAVLHAGRFLEAPGSAPSDADVVVVLVGESGDRALRAARLFRESHAARVLVTGPETAPREVRPT